MTCCLRRARPVLDCPLPGQAPRWWTAHHRFVADYPPRWVTDRTPKGWNRCERCGREHRVWVTTAAYWRQLPRRWRARRLCVGCYRRLCRGRSKSA